MVYKENNSCYYKERDPPSVATSNHGGARILYLVIFKTTAIFTVWAQLHRNARDQYVGFNLYHVNGIFPFQNPMKLTIACVQLNSRRASIDANASKILHIIALAAKPPDMIVLPELALTGYHYRTAELIRPYLDNYVADIARHKAGEPVVGRSLGLAQYISQKYRCFTIMGYPEIHQEKVYNLAVVVAPNGDFIHNYRKLFLYDADYEFGCEENPEKGFRAVDLVLDKEYYLDRQPDKVYPTITTNIGICMDLNPYKFEAPFTAFEFAKSCYQQKVQLIICPMAWLSPKSPLIIPNIGDSEKLERGEALAAAHWGGAQLLTTGEIDHSAFIAEVTREDEDDIQPFVPSLPLVSTANYWVLRFFPFLKFGNHQPLHYFDRVTAVCCNRVGVEDDTMYGGTSMIMQFAPTPHELIRHNFLNPLVTLRGCLGQGEEGMLLRDVEL